MEEDAKSFTQKNLTVFPEIKKNGPFWQNFIREYPYEPQKTSKKSLFQIIILGGSRYLKVVKPYAWHQSWLDTRFQLNFETSHP